MHRVLPALMLLALLASCGAAGEPVPPATPAPSAGLSITGSVSAGIAKNGN